MRHHRKIALLFVTLTLVLTACVSSLKHPSNKIDFYTLEYDPPDAGERAPLEAVIRLDRFSVSPSYNTNRIIYRDRSFTRDAYVYHRWQTPPGDMVGTLLSRDIKHSELFNAVLTESSSLTSTHMVEGRVDEFFEWDRKEGWVAVLAVNITVASETEPGIVKKILLQKTYRSEKPCRQKNPRALAEAMSQALLEISCEIINDIYTRIAAPAHQAKKQH